MRSQVLGVSRWRRILQLREKRGVLGGQKAGEART
jgi:hypothetical protein